MKNVKVRVFVILGVIFSLLSFKSYTASSYYSFRMRNRVVDGSKNGQYHTLSKGRVYISGNCYVTGKDYSQALQADLKYTLYEERWGWDKEYNTINSGTRTTVRGYMGTVKGGSKYYLLIYTTERDYHHRSGSGRLHN